MTSGQTVEKNISRVGQSPAVPDVNGVKRSEVLGDALWLMGQSPAHRHLFLADMDWLVIPPIAANQFRVYQVEGRPYAFASWALVSHEVEERLLAGNVRLRPSDWHSGDRPWLIDVVAPFGGMEGILANLSQTVFAGQQFRTVMRDDKGQTRVVELTQPKPGD